MGSTENQLVSALSCSRPGTLTSFVTISAFCAISPNCIMARLSPLLLSLLSLCLLMTSSRGISLSGLGSDEQTVVNTLGGTVVDSGDSNGSTGTQEEAPESQVSSIFTQSRMRNMFGE